MAKKQPTQPEEVELDLKEEGKSSKNTFVTRWFADYASNNKSEIKMICDLTARSCEEQFHMYVKSSNTEVYAVVFYVTFMAILEFIRERQKNYNTFSIQIANSINIGYTNNDDEENEKVGNFMPFMDYVGSNRNYVENTSETDDDKTSSNCIHWKELNIKKNIEYYKEIQERAFDTLIKEYNTNLRTSEAIFPIFCIFLDHITAVVKMKYKEAEGTDISEISMNVLSLFDIYYSYNEEEAVENFEYVPNIQMKLFLKSDNIATRE